MTTASTTPATTARTLEVFDPAMCCSTGVCGTDPKPELARFAADLAWLGEQGVRVIRRSLAHEAEAFVANPAVKRLLDEAGSDGLPAIVVAGEVIAWGEYPSRERLAQIAGIAAASSAATSPPSDGALDDRTATLIALAAAVVADAESAVQEHHRNALAMGIPREEMIEAINVALHVKGQAAQSTVRVAQSLLVPEAAAGGCCGGNAQACKGAGGCGCATGSSATTECG